MSGPAPQLVHHPVTRTLPSGSTVIALALEPTNPTSTIVFPPEPNELSIAPLALSRIAKKSADVPGLYPLKVTPARTMRPAVSSAIALAPSSPAPMAMIARPPLAKAVSSAPLSSSRTIATSCLNVCQSLVMPARRIRPEASTRRANAKSPLVATPTAITTPPPPPNEVSSVPLPRTRTTAKSVPVNCDGA